MEQNKSNTKVYPPTAAEYINQAKTETHITTAPSHVALAAENVSYLYRGSTPKMVLDQVNLSFQQGVLYALVGPSGSGKTTLLSLLAGLDSPSQGRIVAHGKDVREHGLQTYRRKSVSLVFQSYNLIDYLTPRENVLLGGSCNAAELLDLVGIDAADHNRSVLKLSGGQQQRVAIARALAHHTSILLADEPTGNLDEKTAAGIIDILKMCAHEQGACVVVATHSQALSHSADEIINLEKQTRN